MFPSVVPYVGTWIEIKGLSAPENYFCRRSLRGNVDRNIIARIVIGILSIVVPYVGTWIEIFYYQHYHAV